MENLECLKPSGQMISDCMTILIPIFSNIRALTLKNPDALNQVQRIIYTNIKLFIDPKRLFWAFRELSSLEFTETA